MFSAYNAQQINGCFRSSLLVVIAIKWLKKLLLSRGSWNIELLQFAFAKFIARKPQVFCWGNDSADSLAVFVISSCLCNLATAVMVGHRIVFTLIVSPKTVRESPQPEFPTPQVPCPAIVIYINDLPPPPPPTPPSQLSVGQVDNKPRHKKEQLQHDRLTHISRAYLYFFCINLYTDADLDFMWWEFCLFSVE